MCADTELLDPEIKEEPAETLRLGCEADDEGLVTPIPDLARDDVDGSEGAGCVEFGLVVGADCRPKEEKEEDCPGGEVRGIGAFGTDEAAILREDGGRVAFALPGERLREEGADVVAVTVARATKGPPDPPDPPPTALPFTEAPEASAPTLARGTVVLFKPTFEDEGECEGA